MAPSRREQARVGYVPLRHRRDSYESELAHLPTTFDWARHRDASQLRDALDSAVGLPTWYVGSGGTMAVAQYAAWLHNYRTGRPALARTSLGYISDRVASRSAVVIVSAGAKHPDTAAAVKAALERRVEHVVVVTERKSDELVGVLTHPRVLVVSLDRPGPIDGFLATNSVMSMATTFAVAHLGAQSLPNQLPSLTDEGHTRTVLRLGDALIVLASSGVWGAAIDLETRLVETGLATVQTTDFRNFAHGRHLGLSRNQERTTVVAFSDRKSRSLATKTTAILPRDVPVLHVSSPLDEPIACLDLLGHSMQLVASVAAAANFDPARPAVPEFGRRLYHLKSSNRVERTPSTHPAVLRKLEAAALPLDPLHIQTYTKALRSWLRTAEKSPISGLILDYDGTVCTTAGRFDPPGAKAKSEILRLLGLGVAVGFASGRGGSLPEGLRTWIPHELSDRVHVGMYNCSVIMRLDQESEPPNEGPFTTAATRPFLRRLKARMGEADAAVTIRPFQVSVNPNRGAAGLAPALAVAVAEVVATHNASSGLTMKVVASAHSVDVVLETTSKNLLRRDIDEAATLPGFALAIGDQGGIGGNDFELLAATPLTLSVDQTSGDPTRCWNLDASTHYGPDALIRYLQAIRRDRARVLALRWPAV